MRGWCHCRRPVCVGGPYPRGVSASSQFEDFERSYLALADAFGALMVARHRGDDVATLERAYGDRRRAIAAALVERDGTWPPDEQSMIASIESALGWMDEWEAVDGLAEAGGPEVEPAE